MTGINREKADIGYAHLGHVNAHSGHFNHPENSHNVNVWENDGNHFVFRSDVDEIGPLALQQGRHYDDVNSGDGGYAACMHFLTLDGQRIGTLSADVTSDGHNHVGIYTNSGINSDGSDSQPTKRLNIQGGSDVTALEGYGINQFRFGPRGEGDGTEQAQLIVEGETGTSPYIRINEGGASRYVAQYDSGKGDVRLLGYNGTVTDLRLSDDGSAKIATGGPAGNGEIQFGHGGARIYVDSSGMLQGENDDGSSAF